MTQIVTGEAVALEQRIARLGSRLIAAVIDLVVQFLVLLALSLAFASLADDLDEAAGAAIGLVVVVTVLLVYPVAFESLWRGRTPGKAAMGLQVVRDDGGPIRFRHALVRGLIGAFVERPGLTLGFGAVVASLVSERSKRLGDLAAGTLVVQRRVPIRYSRGVFMPPHMIPWAQSLDLSRLRDDLALAARQFVDRASEMTPVAREQLGRSITGAVVASVSPAPPPNATGWEILSAVLAERRRRDEMRLYQQQGFGPSPWQGQHPAGWGSPSPVPWQQSQPATGPAPYVPPASHVPMASAVPPGAELPPGPPPVPAPEPLAPFEDPPETGFTAPR